VNELTGYNWFYNLNSLILYSEIQPNISVACIFLYCIYF